MRTEKAIPSFTTSSAPNAHDGADFAGCCEFAMPFFFDAHATSTDATASGPCSLSHASQ